MPQSPPEAPVTTSIRDGVAAAAAARRVGPGEYDLAEREGGLVVASVRGREVGRVEPAPRGGAWLVLPPGGTVYETDDPGLAAELLAGMVARAVRV